MCERDLRSTGLRSGEETDSRAGSNRIDIELSSHHMVSASNFQSIEVSGVDWIVLYRYTWIPILSI